MAPQCEVARLVGKEPWPDGGVGAPPRHLGGGGVAAQSAKGVERWPRAQEEKVCLFLCGLLLVALCEGGVRSEGTIGLCGLKLLAVNSPSGGVAML